MILQKRSSELAPPLLSSCGKMDGDKIMIYFDEVAHFVQANYVPIASVAAVGLGFMLLRRHFSGGRCYSTAKLNGKVVIVTGANTGIGKETARDLARRGAKVIIACRNMTKAQSAAEEIITDTGNRNVVIRQLDLASMESIRTFAKSIAENETRLDILINNAGVYKTERNETADGFEMNWGTNHLGPFLLTNLLLDLLKKSAPSRIVNVSSIGHSSPKVKIRFDDPNLKNNYDVNYAYSQSKLANILFTNELARRLQGTGVTCYSLHPGVIMTEITRDLSSWKLTVIYMMSILFFKTPKDGAQTTIHCAVEESLANETGYYYSDCKRKDAAPHAMDEETAKELWDMSAEMVKLNIK
ncbi:retinol dehydrogenase 12-like [Anneissia japonica]|uniref:retinol dehydrogenase 12-like n=1 Tax=Anneissia japonica TaxID=1529436 RepID=UPI001425837A|nr:retinol dehydrogenase 12-like [Anneissia japonica]